MADCQEQRAADSGPRPKVLLVPGDAIQADNGKDVVMVVANGAAERRAVSVGAQFGDEMQVLAGLAAGERVIVEGGDGVEDGARVKEKGS